MGNDKSKEDIFREVKYGIEHLEWEIENKQQDIEWLEWEIGRKQQELKEKKEWLEDISREPDWDLIAKEKDLK